MRTSTVCEEEDGTDLPECAFSNDLEQPEVEESDLSVKIDGLRATANGPHGVVKGEGGKRARDSSRGQKKITTGP